MGRLEDLQAFARVVDARGFSGAARLLGTTKSAVSKQVVRLEDQLGTRLLHRTTRSVSPTAEGQAVYDHALRLLDGATVVRSVETGDPGWTYTAAMIAGDWISVSPPSSTSAGTRRCGLTARYSALCCLPPSLVRWIGIRSGERPLRLSAIRSR